MTQNRKTKNLTKIEIHWRKLFDKYQIIDHVENEGSFDITADQIKEFHEPRLMCKMDFREQVPTPFSDNNLSILAIENGLYRIAKTDTFLEIDLSAMNQAEIKEFSLPIFIETLGIDIITGESQALDAAMASGMIDELIGEQSFLTIRGRRRSSQFEISLSHGNHQPNIYPISGVQIEIDGGYESENCLALIEAKMRIGISDNMNIRQLLYPHIHFENTIQKTVKTYVMFYEKGGIYTFIPMNYINNKAKLNYTNAIKYRLVENHRSSVQNLFSEELPTPNNKFPFPQADDFEKVLYTLLKLYELQPVLKSELFSEIPIVPRQHDYYFNALRWLNLAEQEGKSQPVSLTELGELLVLTSENERLICFSKIFYKDELVQFMTENPTGMASTETLSKYNINETTFKRRRSSVLKWHTYFSEQIEAV